LIYYTHFSDKQGIIYEFYKFQVISANFSRNRIIVQVVYTRPDLARAADSWARGTMSASRLTRSNQPRAWPGHVFPTAGTAALHRDGKPEGKRGREKGPSDRELTLGQIDLLAWSRDTGRRQNRGGGARACGEMAVFDGVDCMHPRLIPSVRPARTVRWSS
jgi:hypothetical protein